MFSISNLLPNVFSCDFVYLNTGETRPYPYVTQAVIDAKAAGYISITPDPTVTSGTTPTPPATVVALTDNSSGTSGGNTIAAVSDNATAANAIATLAAKLNATISALNALGAAVGGAGINPAANANISAVANNANTNAKIV